MYKGAYNNLRDTAVFDQAPQSYCVISMLYSVKPLTDFLSVKIEGRLMLSMEVPHHNLDTIKTFYALVLNF